MIFLCENVDLLAFSFCKALLSLPQLMTLMKAAASHEAVREVDLPVAIRSWLMSAAEAEKPGPTFSRYTFLCERSEYCPSVL